MKPLTDKDKVACEYWLKTYRHISTNLTNSTFTTSFLLKLVYYEMSTRRRESVLDRLFARYFKLRKGEVLERAKKWMDKHAEPALFIQTLEREDQDVIR